MQDAPAAGTTEGGVTLPPGVQHPRDLPDALLAQPTPKRRSTELAGAESADEPLLELTPDYKRQAITVTFDRPRDGFTMNVTEARAFAKALRIEANRIAGKRKPRRQGRRGR